MRINDKNANIRESNYELLRVIAIFMVILLHCLGGWGKTLINIEQWSVRFYGAIFFESFFIISVNLFIFITGYFQIKKDKVNIKKLIELFGITVFWYVLLYFIGIILGDVSFSIKSFVFTIIPLMKGPVWYVNTYIILMIFSPYINKFLKSLDKQQYRKLLILMICIFSILPKFLPMPSNNDKGYGIVTFVLIYSIAGYIRLFKDDFNKSKNRYLLRWFLCSFTVFMLSLLSYKLINSSNAWGYNNLFNILSAMYLFLYFSKLNISSKVINYISTYCFSIYIIHINPSITKFIYEDLLNFDKYYNNFILAYIFIATLIIFTICVVAEFIRRIVFKIIVNNKYFKTLYSKINEKYNIESRLELIVK